MTWHNETLDPTFAIALLAVAIGAASLLLVPFLKSVATSVDARQKAITKLSYHGGAVAIGVGLVLFVLSTFEILKAFLVESPETDIRWLSLLFLGVVGAPFVIWRSIVAQRQSDTAEQGMITDRINKAVEALGAQKTVIETVEQDGKEPRKIERTIPNCEVRIGGLYALERIAQDSPRDHIQIMKIICAFIRNNAGPVGEVPKEPEIPAALTDEGASFAVRQEAAKKYREEWANTRPLYKQPDEIRVALEILSDRSEEGRRLESNDTTHIPADISDFWRHGAPALENALLGGHGTLRTRALYALNEWAKELKRSRRFRLDLRGADLRGADLSELTVELINMENARLQGADLRKVQLQGADLGNTRLQGADLFSAELQGVNLRSATLQGASLVSAKLHRANLLNARLQGADLKIAQLQVAYLQGVKLQGADLTRTALQGALILIAELQGAQLQGSKLRGASLGRTALQGADLTGANLKSTRIARCRMGHTRLRSVDFTQDTTFDRKSLDQAFGVKSGYGAVKLPDDDPPEHWHEAEDSKEGSVELLQAFDNAFKEWAAANPLPKS